MRIECATTAILEVVTVDDVFSLGWKLDDEGSWWKVPAPRPVSDLRVRNQAPHADRWLRRGPSRRRRSLFTAIGRTTQHPASNNILLSLLATGSPPAVVQPRHAALPRSGLPAPSTPPMLTR